MKREFKSFTKMSAKVRIIIFIMFLKTCAGGFPLTNFLNRHFATLGVENINNFDWESILEKRFTSYSGDDLCIQHLKIVVEGLQNGLTDSWAVKMLDSWGKVPAGIMYGNIAELGNFEECLQVNKDFGNKTGSIVGQYCLATVNISSILPKEISSIPSILIGVCLPDSCELSEINNFFGNFSKNFLNLSNSLVTVMDGYCTKNETDEYKPLDIFAILVFFLIGFMMLLSTFYDYIMQKLEKKAEPRFMIFSVLTNGSKLFQTQHGKYPNVIECLNGVRSLSIIWVVFGHSYLIQTKTPSINTLSAVDWIKSYHSSVLMSATVSVDSFFFLSGFLAAWTIFNYLSKNERINILIVYLHRFLRLTPLLAATILFTVTILRFLGTGPFWTTSISEVTGSCERYWWSTLLFVQNYVNPGEICLSHSWYLAVDTQLYILAPLILFPLWKWGRRFAWILPILMLLSNGSVIGTFLNRKITMSFNATPEIVNDRKQLIYFPTHTRYSPWLVGILLAYYLTLKKGHCITLPKSLILLGWIISFAVIAVIIFGPHDLYLPDSKATVLENALYEAFSRISWSIMLSWIVFACTQGYGGVINSILSLPIWQVIGRLSYSIYIIHVTIQLAIEASSKATKHLSDMEVIMKFWGYLGLTLTASVLTVLAFESPMVQLEKIIFSKGKNKAVQNGTSPKNNLGSNTILIIDTSNKTHL